MRSSNVQDGAVPRERPSRNSLSENIVNQPHNAGVVGSSPTPAIAVEGAQLATRTRVTLRARLRVFRRKLTCVTLSVTTTLPAAGREFA